MPWFDDLQTYINPYYLDVTPDVRAEMNARAAYYSSKTRSVGRPVSKNKEWPYRKMTWAYVLSNYTNEINQNPIVLGLDSREKKEQNLMSNEKGQLTLYGQQRNTPIYPLLTGLEISNEGQRGSLLKGKFSFTFFPELTPTGFELEFMQEALFTPGRRVQISFGWSEPAEIYKANKLEFVGVIFGFNWSFNPNTSITAEVQIVSPSGIAVGLSGDQSVQDEDDPGIDPAGRELPPSTNILGILDRDLREARFFPEAEIGPGNVSYIDKDKFRSKRFSYTLINLPISKGSSYMESSADNIGSEGIVDDGGVVDGGNGVVDGGNGVVDGGGVVDDNKQYAVLGAKNASGFINGEDKFIEDYKNYQNNDEVVPWPEDRTIDYINDKNNILKNPQIKPNSLELIQFKKDLESTKGNIATIYPDSMNNNFKGGIKIGRLKALVGSRKNESGNSLPLRYEDKLTVMDILITATRVNELEKFFQEYLSEFPQDKNTVFLRNPNGSAYHDKTRWPDNLIFGGIDEDPEIKNTQGLLTKIDNIKKEKFEKDLKTKGYNDYRKVETTEYTIAIMDFKKKLIEKLDSRLYNQGTDTELREDKIVKTDNTGVDTSSISPIIEKQTDAAGAAGTTGTSYQDNIIPEPINKTYWYVKLGELVAFANNTIGEYEKANSTKKLFGLFELRATNNEAQYVKEVKSAYPVDVYFPDIEMGTYGSFSPFSVYPDIIRTFYTKDLKDGTEGEKIETDVINLGNILIGVDYIRKTYKSFIHGSATNISFRNITNFFDEIIRRINAASGETYQLSSMLFEEPERLTNVLDLKPKNPAEKGDGGTKRRALISVEDSNLAFKHTKTVKSDEEITSDDIVDGVVRPFMFTANVMKPLMKAVSVTSRPSKEAASAAYIAARGEETYQNRGDEDKKAKPINVDANLAFPHFKDRETYNELQEKNLQNKQKEEDLAVSEGFNERWSERYRGALVKMKRLTYDRSTIVGSHWLNRAIYPIELTITIDGINGFKFGDVLKTTMIPAHYNNKWDMVFTVTKILHKVTPSGWDTTLYTAARLSLDSQLTGKDAV